MNLYSQYQVTNIPRSLISNYRTLNLNESELIAIIELLSFNQKDVKLEDFENVNPIGKALIKSLHKKGYVRAYEQNDIIYIDVAVLYVTLHKITESQEQITKPNNVKTQNKIEQINSGEPVTKPRVTNQFDYGIGAIDQKESEINQPAQQEQLNANNVDRIIFLLNRKIKAFELEKIQTWLQLGYTIGEIELAIQKSAINNVDNFNYIEAVLKNSSDKSDPKYNEIERNFEFY